MSQNRVNIDDLTHRMSCHNDNHCIHIKEEFHDGKLKPESIYLVVRMFDEKLS